MVKKFNIRKRGVSSNLIEISAEGVNIPLKQNWPQRWCTLPANFQCLFNQIYNFEVNADDVFVVTFPKCGTTWMQEAAWLLLNDLDYEKAKEIHLVDRSVFLDPEMGLNKKIPYRSIELAANLPKPRLIKTHLPAHLLPKQIWQKSAKIIYCARNPKDAAVSYYHFYKGIGMWYGSMDEFIDDFINDNIMYTPYWPHCFDFWKMRNEKHVFFTTFEEMKKNLAEVLMKLNLVDYLSFDKMKSNPKVNPNELIKASRVQVLEGFQFMRRGITGAYQDELSESQQHLIDEWTKKCLKDYDVVEADIFGDISSSVNKWEL